MPPLTARWRLRSAGLRFVSVGGTAQECATLAASKTSCGDLIFCTDTRDRSLATRVLVACGMRKREQCCSALHFAWCLLVSYRPLGLRNAHVCAWWAHRSRGLVSRPGSVPALGVISEDKDSHNDAKARWCIHRCRASDPRLIAARDPAAATTRASVRQSRQPSSRGLPTTWRFAACSPSASRSSAAT